MRHLEIIFLLLLTIGSIEIAYFITASVFLYRYLNVGASSVIGTVNKTDFQSK